MNALRLIVGLGNPGPEHARQRHNAGFWFADQLAQSAAARYLPDGKLFGEVCRIVLADSQVWLLKPSTFMNRSAQSVRAAMHFWKIDPAQVLIAHDELDLSPGVARLKLGGGHGGQNGLRDIIGSLGHGDFLRLRLGIGHPGHKDRVTPWVLGRPSADDEAVIHRAIADAIGVLPLLVAGNANEAMKQLHTQDAKSG